MPLVNIQGRQSNNTYIINTIQTYKNNDTASISDESCVFNGAIRGADTKCSINVSRSIILALSDYWIDYANGDSNKTSQNSKVNLINTTIIFDNGNATRSMGASSYQNVRVYSRGTGKTNCLLQINGSVSDSSFDSINFLDITGSPVTILNSIFTNCNYNALISAGDISIRNTIFNPGKKSFDFLLLNKSDIRVRFYDCTINMRKVAFQFNSNNKNAIAFKYFSRTEKYYIDSTPATNINVRFTPTGSKATPSMAALSLTTNTNGFLQNNGSEIKTIDLLISEISTSLPGINTGNIDVPTIFTTIENTVTWERRIRGFLCDESIDNCTPEYQIGSSNNPSLFKLVKDKIISGTYEEAKAIKGIVITANNKTIIINNDITLRNIYNFIKAWLVDNPNVANFLSVNFIVLNLGDWNLKFNNATISGDSTLNVIKTTGTIEVKQNTQLQNVDVMDSSGLQTSLIIKGLAGETECRVYNYSDDSEIGGIESSSGDVVIPYTWNGIDVNAYVIVFHLSYYPIQFNVTLRKQSSTIEVVQVYDSAFNL